MSDWECDKCEEDAEFKIINNKKDGIVMNLCWDHFDSMPKTKKCALCRKWMKYEGLILSEEEEYCARCITLYDFLLIEHQKDPCFMFKLFKFRDDSNDVEFCQACDRSHAKIDVIEECGFFFPTEDGSDEYFEGTLDCFRHINPMLKSGNYPELLSFFQDKFIPFRQEEFRKKKEAKQLVENETKEKAKRVIRTFLSSDLPEEQIEPIYSHLSWSKKQRIDNVKVIDDLLESKNFLDFIKWLQS